MLVEVPLKVQNRQREETMLLTDQKSGEIPEDSTGDVSIEQVQGCMAEVPYQTEVEKPQEPIIEVSETTEMSMEQSDLYDLRCKEFQREQKQRRQDTISAIMEYVTHTMSPYIYDNGELEKLCDAIRMWADDWQHKPVPIRLKSTLTTLDLRHFVWNIAERLGSKKDYTGEVRAMFIKRMFPDVMKDIELDSIRNFKFQPDTGSIVIDEPDKGDYHFHYE